MGVELIRRRLSVDELRTVLDDPTMADPLLHGEAVEMPNPGLDLCRPPTS
ncbi:hypothetical protein [Micromonospora sp. NPDC047074]